MRKIKLVQLQGVFWFFVLCLPVLAFFSAFIFPVNSALPGDWDYFAQLYEAGRKSIIEYHQFPWWNAWHMGGVPLYANPQFGVFSLEMAVTLLFGTLTGLKISVVAYFLIGFWGMRQLLIKLGANTWYAALLSYIWIFSSFPIWHFSVGHFTFVTYLLAPWLFYFLLDIHTKSRNWLYVALIGTVAIQSSFHYTTIQLFMVASLFVVAHIFKIHRQGKLSLVALLQPFLKVFLLVALLNAHRVYQAFNYLHDYPRIPITESRTPLSAIYAALTFRGDKVYNTHSLFGGPYAWHEYATYFGIVTLCLFIFLVIYRLQRKLALEIFWIYIVIAFTVLALALGPFAAVSPYSLLKQLPGFEQMQVASRWLGWFVFFAIVSLHALPKRKIIIILLCISLIDVMHSSYGIINKPYAHYNKAPSLQFEQYAYYLKDQTTNEPNMRLFRATQANVGEIYGYEPILKFEPEYNESKYNPLTLRCGVNQGCPLVLTNNALIQYWSPNKIVLNRTGPGVIELNMNPGNRWRINGKNPFEKMRIFELNKPFIIEDGSQSIVVDIK